MLKKIGIISLMASSVLAMHNVDLNINDVDLEANVNLDMGQFNQAIEPNTTFIGFKYMKTDGQYSYYVDPNAYTEINFLMQRKIRDTGWYAGLGLKLNYINNEGENDFSAIPLSFKLGYMLPTSLPVNVYAKLDYAPKVLTLQKAEGFYEYRLAADVELIENAAVYFGFRDIETKYEGSGYKKYNRSGYVGVRFKF